MTEPEAIVAWLTDDNAFFALVGDRVYPIKLPATPTLPAVTYQLVSETYDAIQDGPGLAQPRYRFNVWADHFRELDAIVKAIRRLFNARTDGPFASSVVENAYADHDRATNRWRQVIDVLGTQPA